MNIKGLPQGTDTILDFVIERRFEYCNSSLVCSMPEDVLCEEVGKYAFQVYIYIG